MWQIKKIILYTVLSLFVFNNMFFASVFAQEEEQQCITCRMPSLEFQTYINFQVEVLQVLQNAIKEDEEKQDNKRKGLFSWWVLSVAWEIIDSRLNDYNNWISEAAKAYKTAKMWAIMLATMTTSFVKDDSIWWLAILIRNRPFVRDWAKLQDIDNVIHDAMRDLWMEGIWDDQISSEILSQLMEIRQKYIYNSQNQYGLFDRFELWSSVKYKHIANTQLKLNAMMKSFMSLWNKSIMKEKQRWDINFQFNEAMMERMFESYECVRWMNSPCNDMLKDFANNTKVWSTIKEGFTSSMSVINQANEDLYQALLWFGSSIKDTVSWSDYEELWLTPKQISLLRTVYGIDTTKLTKEQALWLEKLLDWSQGKKIVNDVNMWPLDYFSQKNIKQRQQNRKEREQQKTDEKYLETIRWQETTELESIYNDLQLIYLKQESGDAVSLIKDDFMSNFAQDRFDSSKEAYQNISLLKTALENKLSMEQTKNQQQFKEDLKILVSDIMQQKEEQKSILSLYQNVSTTSYFVQIWAYMHHTIEEYIWNKDTDGLVKNLGKICELQCTNKWTANCYAP